MVLSYIVGQKKNPIPYPIKDIVFYIGKAAICTVLMLGFISSLPEWAQMICNTILILAFIVDIIRNDLPLSSLPVIGKKFRKQQTTQHEETTIYYHGRNGHDQCPRR